MRIWVLIRLVFVIGASAGAFFFGLAPPMHSPTMARDLAVLFIGGAIGVLSWGTWLQMMAPAFTSSWLHPSWRLNPFNFRQPLQFFHLLAYTCMAFGLVVFARGAVAATPLSAFNSAFLMIGAGMLAGLHIFVWVFLRNVERDT